MTILDRKILKELLLSMAFTCVVVTAVAVVPTTTVLLFKADLVDVSLFLRLLPFVLLQTLEILIPVSSLVAVVFVYGRTAADHEITTLKASGIHPYRVLLPGLALAIALSGLCLEVVNVWTPRALYEERLIPAREGTARVILEKAIAENRRTLALGDTILMWDRSEIAAGGVAVLHDLLIDQRPRVKPGEPPSTDALVLRAASGKLRFDERQRAVEVTLSDAVVLDGVGRGSRSSRFVMTRPVDAELRRDRPKLMTGSELVAWRSRLDDELRADPASAGRQHFAPRDVEGMIQERLAHAATPIVFLLLGAPLALIFRSGNRLVAFLLAILIGVFLYYPTDLLAHALRDQRLGVPILTCWSGDFLLAVVGLALLVLVVKR